MSEKITHEITVYASMGIAKKLKINISGTSNQHKIISKYASKTYVTEFGLKNRERHWTTKRVGTYLHGFDFISLTEFQLREKIPGKARVTRAWPIEVVEHAESSDGFTSTEAASKLRSEAIKSSYNQRVEKVQSESRSFYSENPDLVKSVADKNVGFGKYEKLLSSKQMLSVWNKERIRTRQELKMSKKSKDVNGADIDGICEV